MQLRTRLRDVRAEGTRLQVAVPRRSLERRKQKNKFSLPPFNYDWRIGKPTALRCPVMVVTESIDFSLIVTSSFLRPDLPVPAIAGSGSRRCKIRSAALRGGVSRASRDFLQTL